MTYGQNQTILAADYNTFRTSVSNVYGVGNGDSGYGQSTIPLPAVLGSGVEQIKSLEWTRLRNVIEVCANHQGSSVTLPTTGALAQDQQIKAHPPATGNFPTSISTITSNRNVASSGAMTIFTSLFTQTRTTNWDTVIDLVFTATWPSANAARYFFNSGGQLRFSMSRTGGVGNVQNNRWTNFLNAIGTVIFSAHSTTATGAPAGGTAKGYYELTTGYQLVYGTSDPGFGYYSYGDAYYSPDNDITIEALSNGVQGANGDNGSVLTFRFTFRDDVYSGSDPISGTLAVNVDERRATTYLTGISGASYALLDPL